MKVCYLQTKLSKTKEAYNLFVSFFGSVPVFLIKKLSVYYKVSRKQSGDKLSSTSLIFCNTLIQVLALITLSQIRDYK